MRQTSARMRALYRQRAPHYDIAVWTYRLIGLRELHYRRHTVEALRLRAGDTVVDLACGTGLNFALLEAAVSPGGRIIGVDLTDAMLEVAQRRARSAGWANIEFVQCDMASYTFPTDLSAILSTFAISLVPEFDEVIRNGAAALRPGGRMALFDLKKPEGWPQWLVRFTTWINGPFGVSPESAARDPRASLRRYLSEIRFREYYFRYLYLSVGERANG